MSGSLGCPWSGNGLECAFFIDMGSDFTGRHPVDLVSIFRLDGASGVIFLRFLATGEGM